MICFNQFFVENMQKLLNKYFLSMNIFYYASQYWEYPSSCFIISSKGTLSVIQNSSFCKSQHEAHMTLPTDWVFPTIQQNFIKFSFHVGFFIYPPFPRQFCHPDNEACYLIIFKSYTLAKTCDIQGRDIQGLPRYQRAEYG